MTGLVLENVNYEIIAGIVWSRSKNLAIYFKSLSITLKCKGFKFTVAPEHIKPFIVFVVFVQIIDTEDSELQ